MAVRNINSMPAFLPNSKHTEIINDILSQELDVVGFVETNICWPHLPIEHQPNERFKKEFEHSHSIYCYNTYNMDCCSHRQTGGVIQLSINRLCHRVKQSVRDISGLGRWVWTSYRGHNNQQLRILTVYRPVLSQNVGGVYMQHKNHLLDLNNDTCPRSQILVDLSTLLTEWYNNNDLIIVMGDFNDNVQTNPIRSFFNRFDMHEVIIDQHSTLVPTNTYINGKSPIDGIFASTGLIPQQSGYTPVPWGANSDHRCLWVDFSFTQIFGGLDPPMWKPTARRLKMDDPRIVAQFNKIRLTQCISSNLLPLLSELNDKALAGQISIPDATKVLNDLDDLRMEGIIQADRNCRKLRMGAIPWTPLLQHTIFSIQYYRESIMSLSQKRKVNARTLLKLRKRAGITSPVTSIPLAMSLLAEQYLRFKEIKKHLYRVASRTYRVLPLQKRSLPVKPKNVRSLNWSSENTFAPSLGRSSRQP
jgi:hypothetical protein